VANTDANPHNPSQGEAKLAIIDPQPTHGLREKNN